MQYFMAEYKRRIMNNNIEIREATISDLDILLEFEQGVITAERPFDATIKEGRVNYYDIGELIMKPTALVIVACHGNTIVSCGYALEKPARPYLNHATYAYLGFMFTLAEYRGKGINAMVTESLKNWAFSKGLKEVRLTVYNDNEPALRAYEKVGFKRHIIEMRLNQEE